MINEIAIAVWGSHCIVAVAACNSVRELQIYFTTLQAIFHEVHVNTNTKYNSII